MRALAFIAVVTFALAGLLPTAAHARSQTLHVRMDDPTTHQPAVGTKVDIIDMNGNTLGSGTVGANGNASITFELPDGVDKVLISTDAAGAQGRPAFWVVEVRNAAPAGMGLPMSTDTYQATGAELVDLAKLAIAKCDKAAYDRWVDELNRRIAKNEQALDQAQQATDSYARDNNLRVTDLAGARKDRERAEKAQRKLDPSLRNPDVLRDLDEYIDSLGFVEPIKRDLDEARRARDAMPPFPADCKKDKHVMVPGTGQCPDGSGGMLAGALNQIFDSDLAAACTDKSHRRETEREKHEDHKGGKKD